ncbi:MULTISPECIES: hypothetical protein [unclassified Pseudomonas]|uniref:hypothetical protein n=1 Tax=unclassified Pseudomonas TaxID=196821 RepID=UPI0024483659|nr:MULTISPECIES: hypothetical protein [unclassified Pseudomonas]MDG9924057.1 hypothetical protein [Pseudomonas sp. GD04045]MDH0034956.1 hypothetical protein [Pseudomonas sp. GD04019]
MLKTLLVYAHLLASCLALGRVLHADHQLWSWRARPLAALQLEYLAETQRIVGLALLALWFSGLLLVLQGYFSEGMTYLLNQKLWAKVAVVLLLSLNGLLLHRLGFPLLARAPFTALPFASRASLAMLGALSTSGWLFAAFLGVARQWNHALSCVQVLAVFVALLGLACVLALSVAIAAGVQGRRAAC